MLGELVYSMGASVRGQQRPRCLCGGLPFSLETSVCELLAIQCQRNENVACNSDADARGGDGGYLWEIDAFGEVVGYYTHD